VEGIIDRSWRKRSGLEFVKYLNECLTLTGSKLYNIHESKIKGGREETNKGGEDDNRS
jgi:hypothetical protein